MRIGFLSTINNPVLPHLLKAALAHSISDIVVLLDRKSLSKKNLEIWHDRTAGRLSHVDGEPFDIYSLGGAGIPCHCVESHNGEQTRALIRSLGIGCLFNAGTPRRITRPILDAVPHGVVNVHPGILPRYRGCTCVEWAIHNNEQVGNTAHFMDTGYDTGPVIATESYEIPQGMEYVSLRLMLYQKGFDLAARTLKTIQDTGMTPADATPQHNDDAAYWDPMPEELLAKVVAKLKRGAYTGQAR